MSSRKDVLKPFEEKKGYMEDRIASGIEENRKGYMAAPMTSTARLRWALSTGTSPSTSWMIHATAAA